VGKYRERGAGRGNKLLKNARVLKRKRLWRVSTSGEADCSRKRLGRLLVGRYKKSSWKRGMRKKRKGGGVR